MTRERGLGHVLGDGLDAVATELDELRRVVVTQGVDASKNAAEILRVLARLEGKIDRLAVRVDGAEGEIHQLREVQGGRS
jgi:glyceraldehyde-3-phosphate dehydrogenase/erythrose-4-phosphate dehydrogenase